MKRVEIFDPYEAKNLMGYQISTPRALPNKPLDETATDLWNNVMISVRNGSKTVLPRPETATYSLGEFIRKIMEDEERSIEKFGVRKLTAAMVYTNAKMSRSAWSRLMNGHLPDIERGNVFAIALALKLNEDELIEMLYSAGFALNYALHLDAAIMYFIKNGIYDIELIYNTLSQFSDIINGLDCFTFNS